MLVKLAGSRAGSGPVALVHVIRQTQAGMSRCRIFFESLDFASHHQRGSAGSGPPTKVLEGALRLGTYILLRLTALAPHESPQGLGGFVHVFAGAVGISALVMASAEAFTLLKIAGALYLIWLGLTTWREARVADQLRCRPPGRVGPFAKASSSRR